MSTRSIFERASRVYEQASDALRRAGDPSRLQSLVTPLLNHVPKGHPLTIKLLSDKGFALLMLGNPAGAREVYERARGLDLARTQQDDAEILWGIGESFRLQDKYGEARRSFRQAERLFRKTGDSLGVVQALWGAAESTRMLGSHLDAAVLFEKALDLSRDIGSKLEMARALTGLASSNRHIHQYERARREYEQALRLVEELRHDYEKAWILRSIGQLYRVTNQFEEAFEKYDEAYRIFGQIDSPTGMTWTEIGRGDCLRMLGKAEALAQYQNALESSRKTGDRSGEATALLGIAEVARVLDRNPEMAGQLAENARKVFDETGRAEESIHCRLSIAENRRLHGMHPAPEEYDRIREAYSQVGSRWGELHALIGKGLLLINRPELSDESLDAAYDLAEWGMLDADIELINRIRLERSSKESHVLNFP